MFADEKKEFVESVDILENILHNSTVFAETSSELVSTNDQDGDKSPNVMTLTSCTIREGAKQGSSGAKRKYVPVVASLPDNSQMSEGDKLSTKYLDDEVDWDAFAAMNRDQGWT